MRRRACKRKEENEAVVLTIAPEMRVSAKGSLFELLENLEFQNFELTSESGFKTLLHMLHTQDKPKFVGRSNVHELRKATAQWQLTCEALAEKQAVTRA
jgi:hypothetical protein